MALWRTTARREDWRGQVRGVLDIRPSQRAVLVVLLVTLPAFLGDLGQFQGLSDTSMEAALGEGSAERSRLAGGAPSTSVPGPGSVVGAGLHPAHAVRSESPTKFRRKNPPCASAGHALASFLFPRSGFLGSVVPIFVPSFRLGGPGNIRQNFIANLPCFRPVLGRTMT